MNCPECNKPFPFSKADSQYDVGCNHKYGEYSVWYWSDSVDKETAVYMISRSGQILLLHQLVKLDEEKIEKLLVLI
jgi:hypothetical protein